MFLASLILISALSISCIAIYFSIIGLNEVFNIYNLLNYNVLDLPLNRLDI